MAWPLSQDYNEAIQSPAHNFADCDLRRGRAIIDTLGIPRPCSGNFADVYQVCTPDGTRWAVKCFTRQGAQPERAAIRRSAATCAAPSCPSPSMSPTWRKVSVLRVTGSRFSKWNGSRASPSTNSSAALPTSQPRWTPYCKAGGGWRGNCARPVRAHGDLQHGNVLLVPAPAASP